ncbi:TcpQ domain-containing protein [Acerihabitans sp. TG2]|uniref:TcpQ domain-containing protein n=1 Tax=Acerihabitans sp. TG2 TaxID=3096008 RepID=UPI002B22D27B|nr:TcpQ domain-containing protein [Acerihabitans sp. TG2]MEA9392195.1 TcpQ domain-containing protein [Acerihabitans sp. TG2]
MKHYVSAFALALFSYCNIPSAFAGFDVIPSYEYTGAKPPVIQSTKALQNVSPEKNIFIDEPYQAGQLANTRNVSPVRMLPPSPAVKNNSITPKSLPASSMSATEIQALSKSLNHITFIGNFPATIPLTASTGSSSTLSGGLQKIIPTGYGVLLYPSVQKKYTKQHIIWSSGERWLISLDKVLDNNHLKAVVDWSNSKIYVSQEKEKIIPYSETTVVSATLKSPGKSSDNIVVIANKKNSKSPFTNDQNINSPSRLAGKKIQVENEIKPVVSYKPVTLSTWTARSGVMISAMVSEWTAEQGWTLVWRTQEKDYNIITPFTVTSKDKSDAGFMEAMKKVLALYDSAPYPFNTEAYPGQKLLVVTLKGNNKG